MIRTTPQEDGCDTTMKYMIGVGRTRKTYYAAAIYVIGRILKSLVWESDRSEKGKALYAL